MLKKFDSSVLVCEKWCEKEKIPSYTRSIWWMMSAIGIQISTIPSSFFFWWVKFTDNCNLCALIEGCFRFEFFSLVSHTQTSADCKAVTCSCEYLWNIW